jgi:phosphoglycerate kinase
MAKYKTLDDFNLKNKVVLVRVDFNSEIDPANKKVTSDVRIKAHAESTLKNSLRKALKPLCSHIKAERETQTTRP